LKNLFRATVSICLAVWAVAAHAQFLIVPKGEKAGSVSAKSVKAEFHAYGAYATARIEMTFATDPNWANEVDFMMKLPESCEETGFAYWFGDEYVKAKTVEKQRAAAIYEFITSRQRDPALIELVGRRQFRVRIAPIDPTKDLRVEINLVVSHSQGGLALPLKSLFPAQLQSADLTLTTPDQEGWKENWGRPFEVKEGRRVYRFESKPYKAKSDWRCSYSPSRVVVSTGRPASGEGTILVSYTAPSNVSNVRFVAPRGVITNLYPSGVKSLKQGESVTFAARIQSGAGAEADLAIVTNSGSTKWKQSLLKTIFADKAATVVWGARHVAAIKNKAEIMKWGMWLSIPTSETSWLAVPKAEEAALKEARVDFDINQYWLAVAKGGKNSALALSLKKKVDAGLKGLPDWDPKADNNWRMSSGWYEATWVLGAQYAKAVAVKGAGSIQARQFSAGVDRLMTFKNKYYGWGTGKEVKDYSVNDALADRVSTVFDDEGPRISDREFNRLSTEISRLWKVSSKEGDGLQVLPWELGQALVAIESVKAGDFQGRTVAEAKRESALALRLLPLFGSSTRYRALARLQASEQVIYGLAQTWQQSDRKTARTKPVKQLTQGIDKVLTKLRVSRATARPLLVGLAAHSLIRTDSLGRSAEREFDPRTLDLSADQKEFVKHFSLNRLEVLRQQHRQRFENDSSSWRYMHYETRRDPKEFKNLEERVAAWSLLLKLPKPTLEGNVERYYRYNESRDAFVLAARKYGPNHPTTLAARKKMEDEDGLTTGRGKYRADVLLTELELDKLMWKKLTPEEEAKRADLEKKRDELFARMGDPLLIVVAPKDASVSALLPDGRIVTLAWNSHALRWEHRFDLPPGSKEGEVKIPVWIRHAKGQTESREVRLHVDQTAPGLKVSWIETPQGWRVEAVTESGIARVNVALADGRRLVLSKIATHGSQVTWALEIEGTISGEAVVIATDSAHNRTEVRRSFSP
jgi:hypothetical protein